MTIKSTTKNERRERVEIDQALLHRLVSLSKASTYNHLERFDWPNDVDLSALWCDENLLTTFGTELHGRLTDLQRARLSKWEAVTFFSLNVHGIKGALEFVARSIYERRYRDLSEYMHIFMAEENAHMWFFATFCLRYAGKIYPHIEAGGNSAADPIERDFYTFASTLIFEEYVDFYNHKVGKNKEVAPILRDINWQHHVDESRHVAFGREVVRSLFAELVSGDATGEMRKRVSGKIGKMFLYFIGLMYNPLAYTDADIVHASGFEGAAALRNYLRNAPERKPHHHLWFKRTASFFVSCGILDDVQFLSA